LLISREIIAIRPAAMLVTALSVWIVYMLDRVLDARTNIDTPRHRFARKHANLFWTAITLAVPINLYLAFTLLRLSVLHAGFALAALVLLYFFSIPVLPLGMKELATASIFTLGVWIPIWGRREEIVVNWSLVAALAGIFLLLCWWNCVAIETWERPTQAHRNILYAAAIGIAACATLLTASSPRLARAELSSAILFLLLLRYDKHLKANHLRLAVDACLLTPFFFR
jgi:hypothetical protein